MNQTKISLPFGSWKSPISAKMLTEAGIAMSDLRTYKGSSFWRESRPAEKGRQVLMQRDAIGVIQSWTPPDWNVRTRVHEYGGNAYVLFDGGVVFSNFADQRLYWQKTPGSAPIALTPAGFQYADGFFDAANQRLVFVREDHQPSTVKEHGEEQNEIVAIAIPSDGAPLDAGQVLVTGSDFYAFPRVNRKGDQLVWVEWDHPHMPWDRSRLKRAALSEGKLVAIDVLVDQAQRSPTEPSFSADGQLYVVDDPQNWWNLAHVDGKTLRPIAPIEREFAGPLWSVGTTSYLLLDEKMALVRTSLAAVDALSLLDLESGLYTPVPLPFTAINEIQVLSKTRSFAQFSVIYQRLA